MYVRCGHARSQQAEHHGGTAGPGDEHQRGGRTVASLDFALSPNQAATAAASDNGAQRVLTERLSERTLNTASKAVLDY